MKKVMICSAGLGMGNASRISAIIESLFASGAPLEVNVFTWGRGYHFLNNFLSSSNLPFQLYKINSYEGHGFFKLFMWANAYIKNCILLRSNIKKNRPNLILLDSDYHYLSYWGYDIFSLGQAVDVVSRAILVRYRPKNISELFSFLVRENLDALIQRVFSKVVLVPSFDTSMPNGAYYIRVPLIVRSSYINSPQSMASASFAAPPCIITGGSGSGSQLLKELSKKNGWPIYSPKETFSGIAFTSIDHSIIDGSDIVIINGGLSSISECIARKRKIVVLPIENHAEQILNAIVVESLGIGIAWRPGKDNLDSILADLRSRAYPSSLPRVDGASVVADYLLNSMID